MNGWNGIFVIHILKTAMAGSFHILIQSRSAAIFPEKNSAVVGLQKNVICWAQRLGFSLRGIPCSAGSISYDYRGWDFGTIFLAGDAAGLASALTGEGIYPAVISGREIAKKIIDRNNFESAKMENLLRRHSSFLKAVSLTEKNEALSFCLAELGLFFLRTGLIDFTRLEMSGLTA